MIQIEFEFWTTDCKVVHTKTPIDDYLIEKIKELKGIDRTNIKGRYSMFINKGKLFCWNSIEKDLLNLLREENYLE